MTTPTTELDDKKLQELEEKFDPEMRFRPLTKVAATVVGGLLILLSVFHYYTAGFGLLQEVTHRGVHLAFVLGLIFLVFPHRHALLERAAEHKLSAPGNVPWFDWLLAAAIAVSVLYIPWIFDDLAFRVGNPGTLDVVMGSILIVALLEATRRSMGWPLPVIAIVFMAYALAGPVFPGLLKHAGASWSQLVNHQYLTSQGIYGVAVGVVATYVFHFVLFGVLATRIGLGQLFLDVASAIAGRYAGEFLVGRRGLIASHGEGGEDERPGCARDPLDEEATRERGGHGDDLQRRLGTRFRFGARRCSARRGLGRDRAPRGASPRHSCRCRVAPHRGPPPTDETWCEAPSRYASGAPEPGPRSLRGRRHPAAREARRRPPGSRSGSPPA